MKDAIIWPVNASFSSAINVVEYIWNANVWPKCKNKCKEDEKCLSKEREKNSKCNRKKEIRSNNLLLKEVGEKENDNKLLSFN